MTTENNNIVLICLDSVRKDFFDEYCPKLRRLTDVSFTQCRAASSWSVPSHASMLTGLLPHQHGVHTHNRDFTNIETADTFLNSLSKYQTIGVSSNMYASSAFGFDQLFDSFIELSPSSRYPEAMDAREYESNHGGVLRHIDFLIAALNHERPIQSIANGLIFKAHEISRSAPIPTILNTGADQIAENGMHRIRNTSTPFFMFLNFMDAHGPLYYRSGYKRDIYSGPRSWVSSPIDWLGLSLQESSQDLSEVYTYRDLYAATVNYLDSVISRFVKQILNVHGNTTIIITADHGENLYYPDDNYLFGHFTGLTEALMHVPFVMINPPRGYSSKEREFFSHLELGSLIRGIADGSLPDVFADRIIGEIIGSSRKGDIPDKMNRAIRCAYEEQKKYLWDSLGKEHIYSINPSEPSRQLLIEQEGEIPEWAEEFFEIPIINYNDRQMDESQEDIDKNVEKRLKELGYM
jgi:arylsulfatase A-like enzyme